MSLAYWQDTKSINKNLFYFYTLAMSNLKMKLWIHFIYHGIEKYLGNKFNKRSARVVHWKIQNIETKENLSKQKEIPCSCIGEHNFVKMAIFPQLVSMLTYWMQCLSKFQLFCFVLFCCRNWQDDSKIHKEIQRS